MTRLFQHDGISFRYPENWTVEREEADGGWTVSVQSQDTAFLILSCDGGMPDPEEVVETTLAALREDYPDMEEESAVETLAGRMAVGHDIQFFSFDLTNTCWTRCFLTDAGTILVMCQANDRDIEAHGPVLRAICASLEVEEE